MIALKYSRHSYLNYCEYSQEKEVEYTVLDNMHDAKTTVTSSRGVWLAGWLAGGRDVCRG